MFVSSPYRFFIILLLALPLALAACDSSDPDDDGGNDPPPATTGTISGTISLPSGAAGSVGNTRVALYESFDDWQADRFFRQVPANNDGNYSFTDVNPGTYYFDAWKDNNNNSVIDSGDFFGVLGTGLTPAPTEIRAGENAGLSFTISIIP